MGQPVSAKFFKLPRYKPGKNTSILPRQFIFLDLVDELKQTCTAQKGKLFLFKFKWMDVKFTKSIISNF